MNTIRRATSGEQFFACIHFSHNAARITQQYHKKRRKLIFSRFCKVLLLLILSFSNIHADDLKVVPRQAEVIEPESSKKELPAGKLEMSISIDNNFTSSIATDISDLQDKLKNSAKETVNDSMKAIGKEIKSSITDIVKEAVGSMPKSEVAVNMPPAAPTSSPVTNSTSDTNQNTKLVLNNLILARSITKKKNKKLLICLGNSFCSASQDVMTALREQYIIKTGDEYIVLLMDMMYEHNQLLVWIKEYEKLSGTLFPPGRSGIWHPAMVIEDSKEKILFAKRYDQTKYTSKRIVVMMKDDIDRYRNK
jgi:hypothetical protein